MKSRCAVLASVVPLALALCFACQAREPARDGSVLPFPPEPMAGVAAPRLQDSTMRWPERTRHLSADAPNVLIVLIDDVGFGVADTYGGEVHTPTLSRLAQEGLRYNRFFTTSICSPTRASLLTGRNHTRVGSGTIAERAVAFDGYTGVIPKSAATVAEVLKQYGYHTAAFGKWHNTPATETTSIGPKERWPNGYGFEYFYGFLGGETSQWEPRLTENYDHVEPPHDDPAYHLTSDLTDKALAWLDDRQAYAPDEPFLMYWAPGGVHGPHQVFQEYADRYAGKFDDGWDAYRERVHRRQLELGVVPPGTKLTERDPTMTAWGDVPDEQRAFQTRLMEVYAGFVEHTDREVGRLVDGLEARGLRDNTLIFYVFGDNGSSAEGQQGTISELLAQNNVSNTVEQQLAVLDELGGLSALGTSAVDSMYHHGWAWAGSTPFKSTKLVAAHFGGTCNPLVVSWPKGIRPDARMRDQFHHVVDIAPTIYDVLGIEPPREVLGQEQLPLDGVSLAYTFDEPAAATRKQTQFFDNNGSRGIYEDGWFACTFGPFVPWDTPGSVQRLADWDSADDVWELYDLSADFSQADDVAARHPERLAALQRRFLEVAEDNQGFPIGAGNWLRLHPEDRIVTPYSSWSFGPNTRRMPEFAAPGIGRQSNRVVVEFEHAAEADGVLYAVGGAGGGLSVYLDRGHLVYEYNMLLIERYRVRSDAPLAPGRHTLEIETRIEGERPGAAAHVVITADGAALAELDVARTVPAAFTATESFDVGVDLGSPVSPHYAARRPFALEGTIERVTVRLLDRP